jgi:hypothetical protein
MPPQCARCQQFFHVAANCSAPLACAYCAEEHCSWQSEKRFELNFLPTCALWNIGDHSFKYRGCPYFRILMEKETRNKPQSEKLNTKPNNCQPSNTGRAGSSVQFIHLQNPPRRSAYGSRKRLEQASDFATMQLPQPSPPGLNQRRELPSNYMFVPHAEIQS